MVTLSSDDEIEDNQELARIPPGISVIRLDTQVSFFFFFFIISICQVSQHKEILKEMSVVSKVLDLAVTKGEKSIKEGEVGSCSLLIGQAVRETKRKMDELERKLDW